MDSEIEKETIETGSIDIEIPIPNKNEEIDKLTIELLLNKNHYSKYLQHTDTKKYDDFKIFKSNLKKYSIDIIDITSELIENPKKIMNKDVEELFEAYTKSIIRYLEIKSIEPDNDFNNNHDGDDDDILFGNMDDKDLKEKDLKETSEKTKSYWGKEQVIKSKNIANFDINLFRTRK